MKNEYGVDIELLPSFTLIANGQNQVISNAAYAKPDPDYKKNVKVEYTDPFSGKLTKESVLSVELGENTLTIHLESGGSIRVGITDAFTV